MSCVLVLALAWSDRKKMLHCIVCLSLASREGKADAESDRAGSCTRRLYAESLGLGDKHRAAHEESCSSAQPHWGKIMCVRVRGIRPTGQYGFLVTGIDSSGYSMNNECELRQVPHHAMTVTRRVSSVSEIDRNRSGRDP